MSELLPQVLELPQERVDGADTALGLCNEAGTVHPSADRGQGGTLDVGDAVRMGLEAVNRALAVAYGPRGEWRERQGHIGGKASL